MKYTIYKNDVGQLMAMEGHCEFDGVVAKVFDLEGNPTKALTQPETPLEHYWFNLGHGSNKIAQENDLLRNHKQWALNEIDDLQKQVESLKKHLSKDRPDGEVCPACATIWENGTMKICGGDLLKELEDLRWFRDQVNKRVMPGERDTADSAYLLMCELRKDRERLDWMLDNRASVTRLEGEGISTNWFVVGPEHLDHLRGAFETPREAIDAAMKDGRND